MRPFLTADAKNIQKKNWSSKGFGTDVVRKVEKKKKNQHCINISLIQTKRRINMELIIALAMKFWQWSILIAVVIIAAIINFLDKRENQN